MRSGSVRVAFKEKKRFCMHCGVPMFLEAALCPECGRGPPSGVETMACKNCGGILPLVAKFCRTCGASQPT